MILEGFRTGDAGVNCTLETAEDKRALIIQRWNLAPASAALSSLVGTRVQRAVSPRWPTLVLSDSFSDLSLYFSLCLISPYIGGLTQRPNQREQQKKTHRHELD